MKLSENHWVMPFYQQRMTKAEWREILLAEQDTLIFKGTICKLVAENMGFGIVSVYKVFPKRSRGKEKQMTNPFEKNRIGGLANFRRRFLVWKI